MAGFNNNIKEKLQLPYGKRRNLYKKLLTESSKGSGLCPTFNQQKKKAPRVPTIQSED
jgi:hypothetical protein